MAVSWPFDSTLTHDGEGNPLYSRAYSSDVIARVLSRYFSNGVFVNPSSGLQVLQHEAMTVMVKPGAANVNGRHFEEEQERVLAVQAAHESLDRIDTVVLRLNLEQSILSVDLYVVMGQAEVSPAPPQLTRNASVWELGLANLFIAKGSTVLPQYRITDTRLDSERCGVVASIIGDTDTTAFYAQVQADLQAFRQQEQAAFTAWRLAQYELFEAWFTQAQDVLGADAAGNLLALINQRTPLMMTVTLPMSGWSAAKPYTQTVAVPGLLADDTPLTDVRLSEVTMTAAAQLAAYSRLSRIDTAQGALTAPCLDALPDADLTLQLKVVR